MQIRNFDFLHGAIGVGVYYTFNNKGSDLVHEKILRALDDNKIDDKGTYSWQMLVDVNAKPESSIALAHGMSAIIVYLSKLYSQGFNLTLVDLLLNGAVKYVLSQEHDDKSTGSYFPSVNRAYDLIATHSRLGWCYGDLGVAVGLWHAGKTLNNDFWKNKALEVLLFCAKRRNLSQTMVKDACLCHGASGIAQIFWRFYIETQNYEFKSACDFWLDQTLSLGLNKNVDYKTWSGDGVVSDVSMIEGISGIGLTLISCFSKDSLSNWDELILLS